MKIILGLQTLTLVKEVELKGLDAGIILILGSTTKTQHKQTINNFRCVLTYNNECCQVSLCNPLLTGNLSGSFPQLQGKYVVYVQ